MSRIRVSFMPRIFVIREKHPYPLGNWVARATVYFNGQRPALSPADRAVTVGGHRIAVSCTAAKVVCECMRVRVWVRMRVRA